jgi:hypothetical protein
LLISDTPYHKKYCVFRCIILILAILQRREGFRGRGRRLQLVQFEATYKLLAKLDVEMLIQCFFNIRSNSRIGNLLLDRKNG